MTVVKISQIGLWLGLMLAALMGCGQEPSKSAEQKLAHITSQTSPPQLLAPKPPVIMPLTYQQAKDPFINPYRTAQPSAQAPNAQAASSRAAYPSALANLDSAKADDVDAPNTQSSRPTSREERAAAVRPSAQVDLPKGTLVRIDDSRVRQPLEYYELSTLRYQGLLSDASRVMALVVSPDGRVHEVMAGQYLGRHHGRVIDIDANRIELAEAVLAEDGRHYYRQAFIPFIHK